MSRGSTFPIGRLAAAGGFVAAAGSPAWACSVCFGDPESTMAKGAVAGVLVMIGLVGAVLTGVLVTTVSWVHRSRRLARREHVGGVTGTIQRS